MNICLLIYEYWNLKREGGSERGVERDRERDRETERETERKVKMIWVINNNYTIIKVHEITHEEGKSSRQWEKVQWRRNKKEIMTRHKVQEIFTECNNEHS